MLPDTKLTAVSLEFGTRSAVKVFWSLRTENYFYHLGNKNSLEYQKAKLKLLRAFYPQETKWKTIVWVQGKELVGSALKNIE